MYTKIVVPLDGSPLAEGILPYTRFLAKALGVPVELLHAVDPEAISILVSPQFGRYVDVVEADMKQSAVDYLKPLKGSFPDPSKVECSVSIGKAAQVIIDRAAAQTGTLIAMATHGLSGMRRWLLGSVADKVLHLTSNPLLLARPNKKVETAGVAQLKTVVVPLDGSPLAESVLPHVSALAKEMRLEVVLLRAYTLPTSSYFVGEGYVHPDLGQLIEHMREGAKDYLEGKVRQLNAEGLDRVSYLVPEGNAAEQVIEIAQQTSDNFVAMCTHGRSGVGRWVLGSVTGRVVTHSGDPVLVIRAPAERR